MSPLPTIFNAAAARARTALSSALLITSIAAASCSGATSPDPPDAGSNPAQNNTTRPDMSQRADQRPDVDMRVDPEQELARYQGLVINEVAAAGEPVDWFELLNSSSRAIDLSGVGYTDDLTQPLKATFPAGTTLAAGALLRVDVDDAGAGFKLGSDEALGVFTPGGLMIDEVDWAQGDSPAGKSFGRIPDGSGPFKTLDSPTPGQLNQDNVVTPSGRCGDGLIDDGEVCDGDALGEQSCQAQGFDRGQLACRADCLAFDTSGCARLTPAKVVINELTSSGQDQIELFNLGDSPLDLTGWYMGDTGYDPQDPVGTAAQRHSFQAGQTVPARGFLVIPKDLPDGERFGLGGEDGVTLYDDKDAVIDQVLYPSGAAATSYCRVPDGTGAFMSCSVATFGGPNSP